MHTKSNFDMNYALNIGSYSINLCRRFLDVVSFWTSWTSIEERLLAPTFDGLVSS
jgi:hypothetical protein